MFQHKFATFKFASAAKLASFVSGRWFNFWEPMGGGLTAIQTVEGVVISIKKLNQPSQKADVVTWVSDTQTHMEGGCVRIYYKNISTFNCKVAILIEATLQLLVGY